MNCARFNENFSALPQVNHQINELTLIPAIVKPADLGLIFQRHVDDGVPDLIGDFAIQPGHDDSAGNLMLSSSPRHCRVNLLNVRLHTPDISGADHKPKTVSALVAPQET